MKPARYLTLTQETLRNLTQGESLPMEPNAEMNTTLPICPTGGPPPIV
jgi:hypothetical protein